MLSLNSYFDEAKKLLDIERDAVLARRLGIVPQHLNRARKQGWCTDEVLEQLAEITDTPLDVLVLAREASKAGKYQQIFAKAAERAIQAGAMAMLGIVAIGATAPAPTDASQDKPADSLYYRNLRYFFLRFFSFASASPLPA